MKKMPRKRKIFLEAIERLRPAAMAIRNFDYDDRLSTGTLVYKIKEIVVKAPKGKEEEYASVVASAWYWLTKAAQLSVELGELDEYEEPPIPTEEECASECNGGDEFFKFFLAGFQLGRKTK